MHAFRTGPRDDVAPDAPTILGVTTRGFFAGEVQCGPNVDGTYVTFDVEASDDVRGFRLERVDDGEVVIVNAATEPENIVDYTAKPGVREYRVIAIDGAGNESAPATIDVNLGLPGACSSTSSAPLAFFAVALLVRRRRPA